MNQLHIFNPSHDEALAANSAYYYPAKAARILEADLAVLPAWWAHQGDYILLPNDIPLPMQSEFADKVHFVHLEDIKHWGHNIKSIHPWGWDALLVHRLQKAGISDNLLPSQTQLEKIRQLSSRSSAVKILKSIRQDFPETIGESFWCTTETEVWESVQKYSATMLKAPWSSSGRGVFSATTTSPENIRQRVSRILKAQGAVEVEPFYHRLSDFAVEFYASGKEVTYCGLSVFATTSTGAYTGNLVNKDDALMKQLPKEIQQILPRIIPKLSLYLEKLLIPFYEGPLGIDMMSVLQDDGTIVVHPCVEINLRNTMGHVAIALRSQIPAGHTGIYSLRPVSPIASDTLPLTPKAKAMEAVLQFK